MEMLTNYSSVFIDGTVDTFDRGYFPTKGVKAGISYSWLFTDYVNSLKENNLHMVNLDFKAVVPVGKVFAFIPSINARCQFGAKPPVVLTNAVGGQISGRYFDRQLSFAGIPKLMFLERNLGLAKADLRFNVAKNHYLTGTANYLYTFDSFPDLKSGRGMYGFSLEYSYNTIFGPITANINWSDVIHRVGLYLSFGYNF